MWGSGVSGFCRKCFPEIFLTLKNYFPDFFLPIKFPRWLMRHFQWVPELPIQSPIPNRNRNCHGTALLFCCIIESGRIVANGFHTPAVKSIVAFSSQLRANESNCMVYIDGPYVGSCPFDILTVTLFAGVNDCVMVNACPLPGGVCITLA